MKKMISLIGVLSVAVGLSAQSQTASMAPAQVTPSVAKPVDPVEVIADAFKTHVIVALGNIEFAGNEQGHAFQVSLLRDPRISSVVDDIVVEFGDARYQDVIDRFTRGEDVAYASLRHVWQDTTQVEFIWDLPIYEDFFRAVRQVNASLPRAHRLRVLLADPPIDWATVRSREDVQKYALQRDAYAVDLIRREVLARKHRALLVYGTQHLVRKNVIAGAADESAPGIVALLEKDKATQVFSVLPATRRDLNALQGDIGTWPIPSLALLRGTVLGAALWDSDARKRPVRIEDQFDALLYLGPPTSMTMSRLAPALCADPEYMQMRLGRLALLAPPPGARFTPADQLKQYCAQAATAKKADVPNP